MKTLSKIVLVILLLGIVVSSAYSTGRSKAVPFIPGTQNRATSTYANSEVDTIIITRDPSCPSMGFSLFYYDSVKIDYVRCYRVVNGVYQALRVGDTLYSNAAGTTVTWIPTLANTAAPQNVISYALTLSPYCDQYAIEIGYNSSNNGVGTNTVLIEEQKIFARR